MSAALKLMSADEFLEWSLHQEERYELVNGRPVLMTGAKNEHDVIVVNLIAGLHSRLRGGPCRPATADTAARMAHGNVRRPDVTVDRRPPQRGSTESQEPTVFFEVLSPSTRGADLVRKAGEYRLVPTLKHFVLIEPDVLKVLVWSRDAGGGWPEPVELTAPEHLIELSTVGVSLPLSEVYAGAPLGDDGA